MTGDRHQLVGGLRRQSLRPGYVTQSGRADAMRAEIAMLAAVDVP
jgi:hypothetical protein